jgi:hypothetical protein
MNNNIVRSLAIVAALAAAWALPTTAVAQKDSASRQVAAQQNQTVLAQNSAPQLLLVLHADRGGNIARPLPKPADTPNPLGSKNDTALTKPASVPRPASSLGK